MHGSRTALVIQHVEYEPPAVYADILAETGWSVSTWFPAHDHILPDWRSYEAVLCMGGPMSIVDSDRYPWLGTEIQWIREAVLEATPFWGVCLGAQLLAVALGGRIMRAPTAEVGVSTVRLTDPLPEGETCFTGLPEEFDVFQWHSDTYTLPLGGKRLATSTRCKEQAFRWGRSAYGLQFHLEVDHRDAITWSEVPEYRRALEHAVGSDGTALLTRELLDVAPMLRVRAEHVFSRWLNRAQLKLG